MTLSKQRLAFWSLVGIGVLLLYGAMLLFKFGIDVASAQVVDPSPAVERAIVQSAAPATADTPTDPLAVLALVLAAVAMVMSGLHALLVIIAPRTKTTIDDDLRDNIASLLALLRGQAPPAPAPAPAQPSTTTVNVTGGPPAGTGTALSVLLLVIGVGMVTLPSGCAASQRESTIKAALVTVDASREAYLSYDAGAQQRIVEAATSLEDGRAKLAAYRAERAKVETAVTVVYRAIALAATVNDDQSLAALKQALEHAVAIVNAVTGGSK